MRRTRASLTAVAAVAAVVLAACGTADTTGGGGASGGGAAAGSEEAVRNGTADGAARGGTLNILGTSDVDYIDPQITYYSTGYTIARLYHRELFAYPADPATRDKAVPDLAEQLPTTDNGGISADGKTYTITIKQGAQWNTNPPRQVTAADAVIGVKRSCNPAQPFGGLPDFQDLIAGFKQFCDGFADAGQDAPSIKKYIEATPLPGVIAKDDRTVVFTLNSPATYFTDILALSSLSPAPVENLNYVPGSTELGQNLVVDGPYKIDKYEPDEADRAVAQPGVEGGDRHGPRRVRRQDRRRRDAAAGVDPAAAADRHAQRGPAVRRRHAAVADPGPAGRGRHRTSASARPTSPARTSSTTPRSPNNNSALANVKVRQADLLRDQPRQHRAGAAAARMSHRRSPTCCRPASSARRRTTRTRTTPRRPSRCSPRRASRTA